MLCITRKENEEILIDGDIKIKVLAIKGSAIRLGIEGPKETKIIRAELVKDVDSVRESGTRGQGKDARLIQ